jgi:hypothetical protein
MSPADGAPVKVDAASSAVPGYRASRTVYARGTVTRRLNEKVDPVPGMLSTRTALP